MIRVAHLLDGRHFGGAEQMVRRLAKASRRIEVDARVYCLSEGRLISFLQEDEIIHRVFPSKSRYDFSSLGGIGRALREDGIQILQAHTSRTHLFARILSKRVGIPNITAIHSPVAQDENVSTRRHPIRAIIERAGRRWTDHICPVSREEYERLIREDGVPLQKITWIPNGVEDIGEISAEDRNQGRENLKLSLSERNLFDTDFVVGMIASFRPRKGTEVLLRAFSRFIREGGKGSLLIIGDDEFTAGRHYLDELKALARELQIEDRTCFAGFQPNPWELARGVDLVVLPSLFGEGLPLTLIEAMNYALPIAASDVLGNRECVERDRNGWLHPPGDEVILSAQLEKAASDIRALPQMGRTGRSIFKERYEMEFVLKRWADLYSKLSR